MKEPSNDSDIELDSPAAAPEVDTAGESASEPGEELTV
jgi:hypothetical protein